MSDPVDAVDAVPRSPLQEMEIGVSINVQAGRIRLIFVADEIPHGLRRIVEFLNGQMNPAEVLAIEVGQHVGQRLRILAFDLSIGVP